MPEGITAENLLNTIMETFTDDAPKPKPLSFFEEEKSNSVSTQINRLFGRQKPVHKILGGGKSADVLLWRNKKISASVLIGATAIWVLFEWLNYNFLSLIFFSLLFGMIAQFLWSNASSFINRSSSQVPRFKLPEELFVNVAVSIGAEVNRFLGFLQDVATGGDLKKFLLVVASLFAAAIIGSWCNFLTVIYLGFHDEATVCGYYFQIFCNGMLSTIKEECFGEVSLQGFVAAHTLPVLYERYEDEVDSFVYNLLGQVQNNYRKLDSSVLSKIPKGYRKGKKSD